MARGLGWGVGQGMDGYEAAQRAAQLALDELGVNRPNFGMVVFANEFQPDDVLRGLAGLLPNLPVWGFSTTLPFSEVDHHPRSVILCLVAGADLDSFIKFYPEYAKDSGSVSKAMGIQIDEWNKESTGLLIAADGIFGNMLPVCSIFQNRNLPIGGCITAGEVRIGKTYQVGGNEVGSGGLSLISLTKKLHMGSGVGAGWNKIGISFKITRSRGAWIQTLDGVTPAEAFEKLLGYPARDWAFPPLSNLSRLYCLGIEEESVSQNLLLRSPIHVEVDGSFRMNTPVKEGQLAHLMIGDMNACLNGIRSAALQAMHTSGGIRPLFAIAMIDIAWSYLFETRSDAILAALQDALPGLHILGGYTFGQLVRAGDNGAVHLQNQVAQIILMGEAV